MTLTLTLPPTLPRAGVITTIPFTAAEIAAHAHQDPQQVYAWFARLRRAADTDTDDGSVTVDVVVPAGDVVVEVFDDTADNGLEALLDARPTVATALVAVAAAQTTATAALSAPPPQPPKEPCSGDRLEKIVLDAPELRRPGDDGRHVLCVSLPADYATSTTKRYPVALSLPGFSGNAVYQDGFSARGFCDGVIVVGVETRVAEGTSYLSKTGIGDWESYVVDRVVGEIDRRYRTTKKRAVYGHSTGGWNALSIALRHPDVFAAAAASSPDPLDLELWLNEGGALRRQWRDWARAERALGGRGQFKSWAVSWSDGKDLVDDAGTVDADVYARWQAASPLALVGSENARRLSGHLFVTAGSADLFDLYRPSERFVQALRAAHVDVEWAPTAFDHFGHQERFQPLAQFLMRQLKDS